MSSYISAMMRTLACAVLLLSVNAVVVNAQMYAPGQYMPSGSPLGGRQQDPSRDSQDEDRRSANPPAEPSTAKIDPVKISGSDVPTLQSDPITPRVKTPPQPSEFERFVDNAIGRKLPRFGADLLLPGTRDFAVPATATVPPDYVLNVGDIVVISMTGAIEGSVDKEIDTNGRIFLPRIGSVTLAGVRYGDLKDVVGAAIGRQYRGYNVAVGIRQLRGVRVYVTGFANNPGAYTVSSLSTMVNAVFAAGGPAAGGSFRSIKLYRHNKLISDFDLYKLILNADRTGDVVLQNEDVLFIPPVGPEVAVSGSVNSEAIFEAKAGETLETLIGYAGGPNTLADKSRLMLYRLSNFDTIGVLEVPRTGASNMVAQAGDVIQLLSQGTLIRSVAKQSVLVRIEGEVNAPGSYYVPANTRLSDVLGKAGGLTPRAFVFGTRFERTSVRQQQRASFREAIQQLEITLAAAPLNVDSSLDAGERNAQLAGARAVLDRLRDSEPDGRLVLDLLPSATNLPGDFILENNDRITVPPRATTVGVFGAVYRPASFAINDAKPERVSDYLDRAGGPLRVADKGGIFVVRANGSVLSRHSGALKAYVLPGDVIFVPVRTQTGSVWAKIREISTIIFQLGLSTAAFISVTN